MEILGMDLSNINLSNINLYALWAVGIGVASLFFTIGYFVGHLEGSSKGYIKGVDETLVIMEHAIDK